MKQKLIYALECMKKYNAGIMYQECFGFEPETEYDFSNCREIRGRALNCLGRGWNHEENFYA